MKRRKKILTVLLAIAIAVTGLPMPQIRAEGSQTKSIPKAAAAAPVLELEFEGNLTDSSVNNAAVTANNAVNYEQGIKEGEQAIALDGKTMLDLGKNTDLSPEKLTLSFWMKPNAEMSGEQAITWNKTEFNSDGWYLMTTVNGIELSVGPGGRPALYDCLKKNKG